MELICDLAVFAVQVHAVLDRMEELMALGGTGIEYDDQDCCNFYDAIVRAGNRSDAALALLVAREAASRIGTQVDDRIMHRTTLQLPCFKEIVRESTSCLAAPALASAT